MSKLSSWLRGKDSGGKDTPKKPSVSIAFSDEDKDIYFEAKPYTMTDRDKILSLIHAVRYVIHSNVPGDLVECGVWKGGCVMAVARALKNLGVEDRHLLLFDTFEGMSQPTDKDVNHKGYEAAEVFNETKFDDGRGSDWCYAGLEDVQANVGSVGYNAENIHYHKGKVEETLPGNAPERIALLRLDTDWYESTLHEMNTLYPRLSVGGVLIIDDYYTWKGSKDAVDEYVKEHQLKLFLVPLSSGAIAIKQA